MGGVRVRVTAAVQRWLTASPLADRLGVDVRHLARLVTKGVLTCKPGKKGREYPWPESRDAYLRYQIAESVGSLAGQSDEISLERERALLVRRQREEIEFRMEEKRKAVVPQLFMLQQQESLIARFAAAVNGWGDRWQESLVALSDEDARRIGGNQEAELRQAFFELTGDTEDEDDELDDGIDAAAAA